VAAPSWPLIRIHSKEHLGRSQSNRLIECRLSRCRFQNANQHELRFRALLTEDGNEKLEFASFDCEEIGLEPKTLVKAWFEPILPGIGAVEDTLDTTETKPQRLQEYASILRQLWSMLVP
jgi:hypothetical protein